MTKEEQLYTNKPKKPSARKCLSCREWFKPANFGETTCSEDCAVMYGISNFTKQKKREHQKAKKDLNETDKKYWEKRARYYCHKYIRLRDISEPCISCQRPHGYRQEAGHYMSSGGNGHIRYDEKNIHSQCHTCNCHQSANLVKYRENLIKKIGQKEVERLEYKVVKIWTIDELKEIIATYKQKIKGLECAIENDFKN